MKWGDKVEMVRLGNAMNNNVANKKDFQKYVIQHIATFDSQAWDMFCNLVDLDPKKMKKDISFWEKVYRYVKDVDCSKYRITTGMRIGLIQTICEEHFKIK